MCFRMMLLVMLALLLSSHTLAGNLVTPAPPEDPLSAMYTLEDIYQRLENGAAGDKSGRVDSRGQMRVRLWGRATP